MFDDIYLRRWKDRLLILACGDFMMHGMGESSTYILIISKTLKIYLDETKKHSLVVVILEYNVECNV